MKKKNARVAKRVAPPKGGRPLNPIENARRKLESMKLKAQTSQTILSKAAHRLLVSGMECDAVQDAGPYATFFLDDPSLSHACDERKYSRKDANEIIRTSENGIRMHDKFEILSAVLENVKDLSTGLYKTDIHGQFNTNTTTEKALNSKGVATVINFSRFQDSHARMIDTPRFLSVIFPVGGVNWSENEASRSPDDQIKSYLSTQGLTADINQTISDAFKKSVTQMAHEHESNTVWETKPTIHSHKSADYEITVTELKGMINDNSQMNTGEFRLDVIRRMVIAGLKNMKGKKFVLCEEIIIQLMRRHEDASSTHIQFHATEKCLVMYARPAEEKDGRSYSTTQIHLMGTNAMSVHLGPNPALGKIDRAESVMFVAGWLVRQLQNLTLQNIRYVDNAKLFFKRFTDNAPFKNNMETRIKARPNPPDEPLNDEITAIDQLRESFLTKQKPREIVAVKDSIYPKTKLWFAGPSFAVVVISPLNNPKHNYIAVQTFACGMHEKPTKILENRRSAFSEFRVDTEVSRQGFADNVATPTKSGPRLPSPSRQHRQAYDAGDAREAARRYQESEYRPDNASRLPVDLELELQML